jgi:hypothetical protein
MNFLHTRANNADAKTCRSSIDRSGPYIVSLVTGMAADSG